MGDEKIARSVAGVMTGADADEGDVDDWEGVTILNRRYPLFSTINFNFEERHTAESFPCQVIVDK